MMTEKQENILEWIIFIAVILAILVPYAMYSDMSGFLRIIAQTYFIVRLLRRKYAKK
jgi:hypothetical protein